MADGNGACRLAEHDDVFGVAAEEANVLLDPLHAEALVFETGVERMVGGEGGE